MSKIKAALLDDNKEQLLINQQMLESLGTVTIVASCTSAKTFLEEIKTAEAEILFLDLNLGDSYMTGMEVAFQLKLPVIFVSSNTAQYIKEIEKLKRDYDICVNHITKPFTEQEFVKTTQRFLKEIELFKKEEFIHLDFGASKRNRIAINNIVYLSTDKNNGSESNNKQIHFNNRKPENLIDFSFSKMEEKGLINSQFITIHKSFRVNIKHIKAYHKSTESIEIEVFTSQGKIETKHLQVSENYQPLIKKIKK
jgi:CheY-like chemotaxis protein